MIPVDMLVCGERIRTVSCFIFCARYTHIHRVMKTDHSRVPFDRHQWIWCAWWYCGVMEIELQIREPIVLLKVKHSQWSVFTHLGSYLLWSGLFCLLLLPLKCVNVCHCLYMWLPIIWSANVAMFKLATLIRIEATLMRRVQACVEALRNDYKLS